MSFDHFGYPLFLAVVLVFTALSRNRLNPRNLFLLLASYAFYAFWDWRFLGLILVSTVVDYTCGLKLDPERSSRNRKAWLVLSLVVNLGLLATFKYLDFFIDSARAILAGWGLEPSWPTLHVILPVGISFYTFQTLSYTIDVYRKRIPAERNPLTFALFVAFFPQLVAGPIERANRLLPQLNQVRPIGWERLYTGFGLIGWGLVQKLVLADNLGRFVDEVFRTYQPGGPEVLLAGYAFAMQILCDFAGYSTIALGSARMLGFDIMRNFDNPYVAHNPRAFWRRWHISLSTWLRDYLYIPLGGGRRGPRRNVINLLLTMLLGGLWHGAAFHFVLWGAYHGGLLWAHRELSPLLERLRPSGRRVRGLWLAARWLVFFHLVVLGWLLFRAEGLYQFGQMVGRLFSGWALDRHAAGYTMFLLFVVAAGLLTHLGYFFRGKYNDWFVFDWPGPLRCLAYTAGMLALIWFGRMGGDAFIYFQF